MSAVSPPMRAQPAARQAETSPRTTATFSSSPRSLLAR